ncbi:cation/H+ exchanger [Artomyces pyxidatus]|uniref:Cation/H+ exchanger n=1 Tax=Artomyces pyxidatus TaxID=48021 RepID=A0ACB8TJX5_9AGAM|nr:cation/H+ exchanger [Artomyces pyxidatus]
MGEFSREVIGLSSGLFHRAAPEAGVFTGLNPTSYRADDPFVLWVIQATIIIGLTQLLSVFLSRLRQPRVIAEVVGGVVLGPTVMGRIPHFTERIFPPASIPMLSLTSTIGLVFFLFLVGLEIDTRVIKKNAKAATAISLAGLVVPFGLGAALAVPIYHRFVDPSVNYGYFILFVSVAVGITAFPVLCRVLTEVKLLDTTVGVLVLSAGVGNDVVGWVLLALTVALVNASSGLAALYIILSSIGFILFLLFPIRWAFVWLARQTGSLDRGEPTVFMMTVTFVVVLASAFFTDIIGIHPIFGGFLAGLMIPKENGFAISLVEKLEDVISLLFLPQYFVLSGLRTNLGLLDSGVAWGYTFLICVVAFLSKFLPCAAAAKMFGLNMRESGAVGSLMACKGLIEIIVLNVGLQANIMNTRVFSMFVLHALLLTFVTTPLTIWIYPPGLRVHSGAILEAHSEQVASGTVVDSGPQPLEDAIKTKFALVLETIDQLPAAMTLTQMLQFPSSLFASYASSFITTEKRSLDVSHSPFPMPLRAISVDALRLIDLTERTSAVLKSQAAEDLIHNDPVLSVFRTFGRLNRFSVSASLSVVPHNDFPEYVAEHAREYESDMVIVPWNLCVSTSAADDSSSRNSSTAYNPFETLFSRSASRDQIPSVIYSQLVRKIFATSPADVALFVDRGLFSNPNANAYPHIFFPFFGGPDDRLALSFVVQLCANGAITATVVRIQRTMNTQKLTPLIPSATLKFQGDSNPPPPPTTTPLMPDTVYTPRDTEARALSTAADDLLWNRLNSETQPHSAPVSSALTRITFEQEYSSNPLHSMLDMVTVHAQRHANSNPPKPLFVVAGRSRQMAVDTHEPELQQLLSEHNTSLGSDVLKTFGEVATAFVATKTSVSLIVLQSRHSRCTASS